MNAPHLDLADLTAEANGQAIGEPAREHLAGCEHCRAEADRWHLVAAGVTRLMAAEPQPTGTRVSPGHRRGPLVAGAAAALVLIGGASYGVSTAIGGLPKPRPEPPRRR